jgi:hypothetical protein
VLTERLREEEPPAQLTEHEPQRAHSPTTQSIVAIVGVWVVGLAVGALVVGVWVVGVAVVGAYVGADVLSTKVNVAAASVPCAAKIRRLATCPLPALPDAAVHFAEVWEDQDVVRHTVSPMKEEAVASKRIKLTPLNVTRDPPAAMMVRSTGYAELTTGAGTALEWITAMPSAKRDV